MTEALLKLRDYATKRVAPACQRLHVLLQEVLGWSKLCVDSCLRNSQHQLSVLQTPVRTLPFLYRRTVLSRSYGSRNLLRELAGGSYWTRAPTLQRVHGMAAPRYVKSWHDTDVAISSLVQYFLAESFKAANKDADVHTPPSRHDVLEVNEYLMSGLVVSSIDRWFMGTLPKFSLSELAVPHVQKLNASMDAVSDILGKADGVTWPPVRAAPYCRVRGGS